MTKNADTCPAFASLWTACLTGDWEIAAAKLARINVALDSGQASLTCADPDDERARQAQYVTLTEAVESQARPVPFVGLSASFGHGSDSYAWRVVAVSKSGHRVTLVRADGRVPEAYKGASDEEIAEVFGRVFMRKRNGRYADRGSYARQPFVSFGTEQKSSELDRSF